MAIKVKRAGVRRAQCSCSMPAVWWALSYARGALVIFHSPRSCAHVVREKDVGSFHRLVGAGTYAPPSPVPLLTSGIGEGDAVFGAAERLREALQPHIDHPPALLAVISGSSASLIGDDVGAIARAAGVTCPVVAIDSGGLVGSFVDGWARASRAGCSTSPSLILSWIGSTSRISRLWDCAAHGTSRICSGTGASSGGNCLSAQIYMDKMDAL